MADVHSPVLLPSKFQLQMAEVSMPVSVKDREAYGELLANYTALKAKANKILLARVDSIRHGTVVDLTRNYIGAMGLQAMTSLLAKNEMLEEVHMPGSGLNNDSVVFFCRAMLRHPSLRCLDLSHNNISLGAGQGLVSLLQHNHNLVHINLSETQIPDAIMKKINQSLERNRAYVADQAAIQSKTKTTAAKTTGDDAMPTLRSTNGVFPTTIRETVRKAEWRRQEEDSLERLTSITHAAAAAHTKYVPSPDVNSGWRLIEVAILAPPFLFVSEIEQLLQHVFPRINEELISCKVQLLPLVDPSDEPVGVYLKNLRFAIATDILRNVEKSRLLTIELIGDRDGDYVQLPASEMVKRPQMLQSLHNSQRNDSVAVVPAESIEAPPLQPVLQLTHARATELSSWLIIAARRDTRRMGLPPSLAPLLTEEPPMEHPDHLQQQVRRTVTVGAATVCGTQKIECDNAVKYKKWHEHQRFRERALDTAAVQELVIRNYNATFDHCSEDGQVHLKNLEEFTEAMYERMCIIATSHFSPAEDGHPVFFQGRNINLFAAQKLRLHQERLRTFLLYCVDHALFKKSITNRLDVYVIAPPSRNAFLLHGVELMALTSLIGSFTSGLMSKESSKYRIAYHTTRSSFLTEEPTDLREIICNIIFQLCHDQEVYRRAITEVDHFRLQQIFVDVLTERTKSPEAFTNITPTSTVALSSALSTGGVGSEKNITVVVLDGLDCVLPPVNPCEGLRKCEETGKDVWGVPGAKNQEDPFTYIPQCLSRNVRLILGCETGSETHRLLESRGRDSVELFAMGPMTPNDFDEMLRPEVMSKYGVTVSDDDFVVIRKKEEALSPEFIALVVDALRAFNETPGVETHTVLASLPGTVQAMVERMYNNLIHSFSPALIRKCTRLLMCSRWGIYESLLRSMLQLPQGKFNQLLRMMRPLLEYGSSFGIESGNALHDRVSIRSRAFREFLEREDLHVEGSENDHKVWHEMLAHAYLNVVYDAIQRETRPPLFALMSTSPYERMAVKELPYHASQAEMRHILFNSVLSMPFVMLVYRNSLGYHFVRDLVTAFNTLYELYELGEYTYEENHNVASTKLNSTETTRMPSSLSRLRDYIYFLRHYNAVLTEFPHLVLQIAIEGAALHPFVASDAREYITLKMSHHAPITQRRVVFFETLRSAKPKIHHGSITACVFAPNGKRIATGGVDRSVCTLSPVTGAVAVQARQAQVRIEEIIFCETAAYHAAICYDRSLFIYDSAQMKLVSKCDGGIFAAPLTSVAFSARGRFYMVATADLHLRVFETEKSQLMMHVNRHQMMQFRNSNSDSYLGNSLTATSSTTNDGNNEDINVMRGYAAVVPHRSEEEVFYTTCQKTLIMWKLTPTRDEFLVKTHFELPFTVHSGKAFLTNKHLLFHPAPLASPADGRSAPPRLLRLCSVSARREMAVLKTLSSQLLYQISENESLVATALEDGSIALHRFPWLQLDYGDEDLIEVAPLIHFTAFRKSPIPTVRALRFRGDSKGLFALGNDCEMKFWIIPRRCATGNGVSDITDADVDTPAAVATTGSSTTSFNAVPSAGPLDNIDRVQQRHASGGHESLYKDEDEDEILEGVADGEFVVRTGDITAWDVAPVTNTNGADVVFGDSSGRLTMLRLWSPLM